MLSNDKRIVLDERVEARLRQHQGVSGTLFTSKTTLVAPTVGMAFALAQTPERGQAIWNPLIGKSVEEWVDACGLLLLEPYVPTWIAHCLGVHGAAGCGCGMRLCLLRNFEHLRTGGAITSRLMMGYSPVEYAMQTGQSDPTAHHRTIVMQTDPSRQVTTLCTAADIDWRRTSRDTEEWGCSVQHPWNQVEAPSINPQWN